MSIRGRICCHRAWIRSSAGLKEKQLQEERQLFAVLLFSPGVSSIIHQDKASLQGEKGGNTDPPIEFLFVLRILPQQTDEDVRRRRKYDWNRVFPLYSSLMRVRRLIFWRCGLWWDHRINQCIYGTWCWHGENDTDRVSHRQ